MHRITVHVPAMLCRHDVRAVSAAVRDLPGIRTVVVDVAASTVSVEGEADIDGLVGAVRAAGFDAVPAVDP